MLIIILGVLALLVSLAVLGVIFLVTKGRDGEGR
jgi:hypothetical protein